MFKVRISSCYVVFIGLCLSYKPVSALEFHPGASLGAQFTDNAELAPADKKSDTVIIGGVAASLAEEDGPLVYETSASFRRESYLNDTFDDRRYFNLGLNANWAMIKERVNWYLTDEFRQTPIRSLDSDTPTNRQDSNAFTFGTSILFPVSGRQRFTVVPEFAQYYYKDSPTDNKQYSLTADWSYQMFRLANIGLSLGSRQIKYTDKSISDTTFTNAGFIVTGQRVYSTYTIKLGATNVKRDDAQNSAGSTNSSKDTGFTGSINWQLELSSRSAIEALVLSEITDTSSVSRISSPGNPSDVQLATDAVRNSIIGLTYSREDESLHTSIWGEYRKIRYSDNTTLNTLVQSFGAKLDFPVTQLVSSGVFVNFDNTKREETFREDKRLNVGVVTNIKFTTSLSGVVNVQYRTKESTDSLENYDEFSAFASLSYGFGNLSQRTIAR